MPKHLERFVALGLLLALVSTACRAGVPTSEAIAAPTPSEAVESAEPPTPEATAEVVEPGPAQEPPPEVFTGDPPARFVPPESWNDELVADPSVIEGVLDNGLNYMIRRNERPGQQAQLRLVVRTGSVNEAEADRGAAHFLEHMMFNGTERFPGNEIVQVLEGFGSGFGADVNAYTNFEETVYELQVPSRSSESLQLGFDVLYEWATSATIDPEAVIAERGVVREEHRRSVEPLSGRLGQQMRTVLLAGSNYLGREPIGSAAVIDTMTAQQLRAFYEQWYRPDLMTVIAVGDFDAGDVERRIVQTFAQPATSDPLPESSLDTQVGPLPEATFLVATDSEIRQTEVAVRWRLQDPGLGTQAANREAFVGRVAMDMLHTRLFERVQGGVSVMDSASARVGPYTTSTQVVALSARSSPEALDQALVELLTELEQVRQHGFTEQELELAVAEFSSSVEQDYAMSETRQDRDHADDLVRYALGRSVTMEPDEARRIGDEILASITTEDARLFLFDVLATEPFVFATGPASAATELPSNASIEATYRSIVGMRVEEPVRPDTDQTSLMERPDPAGVVDRQSLEALGANVVTYDNGLRLAYKTTTISENVVLLQGFSHGGTFVVEGPEVPLLSRSHSLVAGSGFESVDIIALRRILSGSIASLGVSIGRSDETLSGEAATEDLETLLQLVHLQMTEPTISELELRQFDDRWRPLAENPLSDPGIGADLELWRLRYGDSPWLRLIPTVADLDALDRGLQLDAYKQRFANAGDFVFVVVGDFDENELIDLGARYLGTLPDAGVRDIPIDRDPGVPEENLQATVQAGIGDQGRVRINWESPYPFSLEASVTAQALELVVNARLRDLVREELGASYSPRATVTILSEPKSWVDTIIEIESDPDRVSEVSQTVHEELDRIRSGDIDQQYLDLALTQMSEEFRFASNRDWMELMTFHVLYPDRSPSEFRERADIAASLTVADIAATAQVVFPASRSVEVWLIPAATE